jgi:hypothetical protein
MRFVLSLCALGGVLSCQDAATAPQAAAVATDAGNLFDGPSIALIGRVGALRFGAATSPALEGVRVCIDDTDACAETWVDGMWMIAGIDPEREVTVRYEKQGFLTVYQPIVTPMFSGRLNIVLRPVEGNDARFQAARATAGLDPLPPSDGLGSISFNAIRAEGAYLDGKVQVRLEPEYGVDALYAMRSGELVTEIPENDYANWGIFLNVPPGDDYALVFTMDDGECAFQAGELGGWPAHDGRTNAIRVPVHADGVTYLTCALCTSDARP